MTITSICDQCGKPNAFIGDTSDVKEMCQCGKEEIEAFEIKEEEMKTKKPDKGEE